MVAAFPAMPLLGDKACIEQDAEVLGDGGTRHHEMPGDGVDGTVGLEEEIEHPPARGVADGFEDVLLAIRSCDHAETIRK